MEFKDYYGVLGIERTASEDEVRKAYRRLARKYHPDVSKEPDAARRMQEINEANEVLRDKEKRAAYDALAEQVARGGQPQGEFSPPPDWDTGFEFHRGPRRGPAEHAEFSEFFSSLFGAAERGGTARENFRARGEDHYAAVEIPLEDALKGAERAISLRALQLDAEGHPHWENRTLHVKIPPGVRPGQFIRLPGPGHARPWRRARRRPVSRSADRAAARLPRRGTSPLHDAAGHAERSRAWSAGPGCRCRPAERSR